VIGLNPALQKRFILDTKTPFLTPGNVHRASEVQQGIGGKGQDVFVALHCLSSPSSIHTTTTTATAGTAAVTKANTSVTTNRQHNHDVKLAQFLGKGLEGDTVLSYFLNRHDKNMDLSLSIRSQEKLRICTTIVTSKDAARHAVLSSSTELVEPSGTIQPNEVEEMRHAVKTLVANHSEGGNHESFLRGICIMGSMPPGCPSSLYADLYRIIISNQTTTTNSSTDAKNGQTSMNIPICLVDSVVGLDHLFHEMNLHRDGFQKTNMIKINLAELCKITGVKTAVQDVTNAEIDQVKRAMKALYDKFPESYHALSYVAITNGMYPAFLVHIPDEGESGSNFDATTIYRLNIPSLSQLMQSSSSGAGSNELYTIGAGDTVTASTLAAWEYLRNRKSDQRLDECVRASLLKKVVFGEDIVNAAFAFGLACGTASCIEEENSVFNIRYALQLFEQMDQARKM
jgi:fructose-1-phosphate kinase PfkB-like protein